MVLIAAYELAADAFEQSLLLSPFQIQSQIRISNRAYFLSNCQCFLFRVRVLVLEFLNRNARTTCDLLLRRHKVVMTTWSCWLSIISSGYSSNTGPVCLPVFPLFVCMFNCPSVDINQRANVSVVSLVAENRLFS